MSSNGVKLLKTIVPFVNKKGTPLHCEAFYQDTMPEGSSVGTVIALHGAPGSHKDFKYFYPHLHPSIRFVGLNFPGFGHTNCSDPQNFDNVERQSFVKSMVIALKLAQDPERCRDKSLLTDWKMKIYEDKKVIFMGHSRGCENALFSAVDFGGYGFVMLNPIGLRPHRGIRPALALKMMTELYDFPGGRFIMKPINKKIYDILKIKVSDGDQAYKCVRTMRTVALADQGPYIEKANERNLKILYLYAGKDFLIENEIQEEAAKRYKLNRITSTEKTPEEEEKLLKLVSQGFVKGENGYSIFFANDTHYLNKDRAKFTAQCVSAMFGIS
ncbi:hypothetical protein WR25_03061 [Diploscapter pachys]|uniref:AB hydrolase-1 domain-containing protein n=1 Tax=Diploscapter pachys TaxID=2018661 RepID=A0A2A2KBK0_9BILA|nr:hypothetical protein WR25_03061 [Diploscapter pachys]